MTESVANGEVGAPKSLVEARGRPTAFRWLVVVGCLSGLMVGSAAINTFGFSVLLKPLASQLGLSRGDISLGVAISHTLTAVTSLFIGYLMDRYGIRRIMVPGILLFAAATAAYGLIPTQSAWMIYLVFVFSGFATAAQKPIGYVKIISLWFDNKRGLALGIALAGVGLGTLFMPQVASVFDRNYGTHVAFAALGVLILLFALVPVSLLFREPSQQATVYRATANLEGFTLRQAMRD